MSGLYYSFWSKCEAHSTYTLREIRECTFKWNEPTLKPTKLAEVTITSQQVRESN